MLNKIKARAARVKGYVADAKRAVAALTVAAASLSAQGVVTGTAEHWTVGVLGTAATVLAAAYAALGGKTK